VPALQETVNLSNSLTNKQHNSIDEALKKLLELVASTFELLDTKYSFIFFTMVNNPP